MSRIGSNLPALWIPCKPDPAERPVPQLGATPPLSPRALAEAKQAPQPSGAGSGTSDHAEDMEVMAGGTVCRIA